MSRVRTSSPALDQVSPCRRGLRGGQGIASPSGCRQGSGGWSTGCCGGRTGRPRGIPALCRQIESGLYPAGQRKPGGCSGFCIAHCNHARCRRLAMIPNAAMRISAAHPGSGTLIRPPLLDVSTAMPPEPTLRPEMSDSFSTAPAVVYSPTVPLPSFTT
jgi:hypothetical protein